MCSPLSSSITSHSCISVIFLPLPLTGNFSYFGLFPVFLLQWSPNRECLCPTKTSLMSFPQGQQYPVKVSKSKIAQMGKQSSLLCLENLQKWSIEGIVDCYNKIPFYPSHCPHHPATSQGTFLWYTLKYQPRQQCISEDGCLVGSADIFQHQNYSLSQYFPPIFETRRSERTSLKMPC